MHIKAKITIIIIITLIIGILIGAMLNRAIIQHRIKSTISLMQPGFLSDFYRDLLRPDEDQARKIQQILERHAEEIMQIRRDYQDDMTTANESLWAKLQPILTPEQEKRITRRFFRRRDMAGWPQGLLNPLQRNKIIAGEISWLKAKLSLSQDQVDQIRKVFMNPKVFSALFDPRTRERRSKKPLVQFELLELDQAIRNILTDDQKTIYDEIKAEWKQRLRIRFNRQRQNIAGMGFPGI